MCTGVGLRRVYPRLPSENLIVLVTSSNSSNIGSCSGELEFTQMTNCETIYDSTSMFGVAFSAHLSVLAT
jgi:hypothetical protein